MSVAELGRARSISPTLCNDCVAKEILPGDLERIEETVRGHFQAILEALAIDTEADHNTRGTASRVARMLVHEACAGRFQESPDVTDFPNVMDLDEVVAVGPVRVRSLCAHHFCPIEGSAVVGVIPNGRIIGLSKFARLTNWVMARPQIQEEATLQLADAIEAAIEPKALGVIVTARHTCMTWRGVKEHNSAATTSVMRGLFRENVSARAEFLALAQRNERC